MDTKKQKMVAPPKEVPEPSERMKRLTEKTRILNVENSISIQRYWRAAPQMLQMASTYLDEENFENAFLLYMKYITLFVEKLPSHPDYRDIDPEEKSKVRKKVKTLLNIVELIKKKILDKYRQEYEDYLKRKKEYDLVIQQRNLQLDQQKKHQIENEKAKAQDDFVKNLQKEIDKKKKELANKDPDNAKNYQVKLPDDEPVKPPTPEPGESSEEESSEDSVPKADYSKRPIIDRSTKPSLSILDDADSEFLRQQIVPFHAISEKFSQIAKRNTDSNIETCGVLCGQLKRNCFTITHIMVPKQSGTANSCTSINEEELAIEQEKHQLITLGWIHTHPSQGSFLSSIDLHTHALYQKMLPEAIAIVVAPSTNEICMYSLTDYGLDYILKCKQTGFHPHANEERIYHQAKHTVVDDKLSVQVIDLR